MYPITCAGGYPIPIKKGRFSIWGISVTSTSTAAVTRITLVDSDAFREVSDAEILTDKNSRPVLCDLKGIANADSGLSFVFPEPIKVRNGVTIANGTNLLPGRNIVYIS
jgi:hypothetical protein